MRDFKKLPVWQKGIEIVDKLYSAAGYFPEEERYGLRSQSTRAAVSIPSNIADGSGKKSTREYIRYLETSLASAFELETHLIIVKQRGWFPTEKIEELLTLTTSEQKMTTKFIDKIA
jgi:four helix bundle protein